MLSVTVILAGGQSQRMGFDKKFIQIAGTTLLKHVVGLAKSLGKPVILAMESDFPMNFLYGCPILHDAAPYRGPLVTMAEVLTQWPGKTVLFLPVDMPLLMKEFLIDMVNQADSFDVVFPFYIRPYPLPGVFKSHLARAMNRYRASGSASLIGFIRSLPAERVCIYHNRDLKKFGDPSVFLANLNTPEDRASYEDWMTLRHP